MTFHLSRQAQTLLLASFLSGLFVGLPIGLVIASSEPSWPTPWCIARCARAPPLPPSSDPAPVETGPSVNASPTDTPMSRAVTIGGLSSVSCLEEGGGGGGGGPYLDAFRALYRAHDIAAPSRSVNTTVYGSGSALVAGLVRAADRSRVLGAPLHAVASPCVATSIVTTTHVCGCDRISATWVALRTTDAPSQSPSPTAASWTLPCPSTLPAACTTTEPLPLRNPIHALRASLGHFTSQCQYVDDSDEAVEQGPGRAVCVARVADTSTFVYVHLH